MSGAQSGYPSTTGFAARHTGAFVTGSAAMDPKAVRADESAEAMLRLDGKHVWHPYGPMPSSAPPYLVESAEGVRLHLDDGRQLVDAMSSWWAAIHGYRHPVLDAAVRDQIDAMSHVMFGGLTHRPAIRLAHRLVEITPTGLEHVFFCDSGSVAVEVAAKMAMQYWRAQGRPAKHRLITWRGGYHGDTLNPMSVCDPDTGMHGLWRGILPEQFFVAAPPEGFNAPVSAEYVAAWEHALTEHAPEIAAIIVEPVAQGAGAMQFHSPEYLLMLRELADRFDVLLIFDEIATGFGRTGRLFAADHAGVTPDIMCLGKAMTGGYLSMAATVCTPGVAGGISRGSVPILAHGPTFMANPLAASVSLASIDLLLSQDWSSTIARIEQVLTVGLAPLSALPGVLDVRVLGGIGVVQMRGPVDVPAAAAAAVDQGVWMRPFNDLIYAMPPYVCTDSDLLMVCRAISEAASVPLR